MGEDEIEKVDKWAAENGATSRPDAIRQLTRRALAGMWPAWDREKYGFDGSPEVETYTGLNPTNIPRDGIDDYRDGFRQGRIDSGKVDAPPAGASENYLRGYRDGQNWG